MKLTLQLVIEPGDGSKVVTEVATLEREALADATLGLTLAESKMILAGMQESSVTSSNVAGFFRDCGEQIEASLAQSV
jgi:hypothetical protein